MTIIIIVSCREGGGGMGGPARSENNNNPILWIWGTRTPSFGYGEWQELHPLDMGNCSLRGAPHMCIYLHGLGVSEYDEYESEH
eukprot:4301121-Pyramimonas_sp.AAC.1